MNPLQHNPIRCVIATAIIAGVFGCGERTSNEEEQAGKAAHATATPTQHARTTEPRGTPHPLIHDDLPAAYTEHVMGYGQEQVPFEMVLIPGSAEDGIRPFYMCKTEVSRKMFLRWAYGDDLDDWKQYHRLVDQDLRPSPIYTEHIAMHVARDEPDWLDYPALAASWRTARAYCLWLSEQTGRVHRLPTDEEWMHVLRLSGGVPKDPEVLLRQAVLEDNSKYDRFMTYKEPRQVLWGKPNKLGLYHLLGNAAEWVQPVGEERWVRGGHFLLKADQLTQDWRAVEDQRAWNETYPQLPPSRHWYLDFYVTGIRLVCELGPGQKP